MVTSAIEKYDCETRDLEVEEMDYVEEYLDHLCSTVIGVRPMLRHGYPTLSVRDAEEAAGEIEDAQVGVRKQMSWIAEFHDRESKFIMFKMHDEELYKKLYGEDQHRGRLILMGEEYQTCFKQQYPWHMSRTYIVVKGEVSV
jgi:hypothetical protein